MGKAKQEDRYTQIRPAFTYDVAANESWLEDSAREGYRLVGFRGVSGVFEACLSTECRYRCQPMTRREKEPETAQREDYREQGWDYAATIPGVFHIWRCDDPAAPEVDTDPVVQAEGYRYLRRRNRWDTVRSLVFAALLPLLWMLRHPHGLAEFVRKSVPGELLLLLLFLLTCGACVIWEQRIMGRLLHSLREGVSLTRPAPYRLQLWLARGMQILYTCALVLFLFGGTGNVDRGNLYCDWEAATEDGIPLPQVAFLDIRALEETVGEPGYGGVRTKVHELAPRMYQCGQAADLPGGGRVESRTMYYRMLTPGLARRVERELLGQPEGGLAWEPLAAQPCAVLDAFWWGRVEREAGFACQRVVAVSGTQVLDVVYEGAADLRQAETALAAVLAGP